MAALLWAPHLSRQVPVPGHQLPPLRVPAPPPRVIGSPAKGHERPRMSQTSSRTSHWAPSPRAHPAAWPPPWAPPESPAWARQRLGPDGSVLPGAHSVKQPGDSNGHHGCFRCLNHCFRDSRAKLIIRITRPWAFTVSPAGAALGRTCIVPSGVRGTFSVISAERSFLAHCGLRDNGTGPRLGCVQLRAPARRPQDSALPSPEACCLLLAAWCLVLGAWCLLLGAWSLVLCAWCFLLGAWCSVLGAWCSVLADCCLLLGAWCFLLGARCLLLGAQSLVLGASCLVLPTCCLVNELILTGKRRGEGIFHAR